MHLETKNLLENSRESCYLECGSFFGQSAVGYGLQVSPGRWNRPASVAGSEIESTKPITEVDAS